MQLIESIRQRVARNEFEFSRHAVDQAIRRNITVIEIRQAIAAGEVIEDYPSDRYGPSCILFGTTEAGRAIHIQCSYPSRPLLKLITVYEPDPTRWSDFKKRRR